MKGNAVNGAQYAGTTAASRPNTQRVVLTEVLDLEKRLGHGAASSTGARIQAAVCEALSGRNAGTMARQSGTANTQRGLNRHPSGAMNGGGTVPSIANKRGWSDSSFGMLPRRPSV